MEGEGGQDGASSVVDVFGDYKARRAGILKALTTDFEKFYRECHPERENLCLFGLSTGDWRVSPPVDYVPSELPEPTLGINFSRDAMPKENWLHTVAAHCDSWLLAVAFFLACGFNFDKAEREHLFSMINDLPTVHEMVTGATKKKSNKNSKVSNDNSNKFKSSSKELEQGGYKLAKHHNGKPSKDEDVELEEEGYEDERTLCGKCREVYASDEFWIGCDICDAWYHGKCVKITEALAKQIKKYKCPVCSSKRAGLNIPNRQAG
ncbi:Alfin [Parasponia andersonii]|uniref:PHD finger protein ALFIN-LIKE n=1 Tax=Parasponia andersonii TaxID=3476 RepID=A0A2P5C1I1_PARAD|nr:Alfin [Parasponia andersonii]